jgi:hypothetical protein
MSINKRIFGTPLKGIVRDKLEARQGVTGNLEPGESLEGSNIAVSNYDYASKLPFVRMWTSVKIIESADIEILETIPASEVNNPSPETLAKLSKDKADEFGTVTNKTSITEVKNPDGTPKEYIVRGGTRDQMDYVRKTYEIGNHNYLENYGEAKPNESVSPFEALFPNESEKNPLMKPQSGITSITSETEGGMGLIKKTTVNFTVHNFYDFDNIFSKYFLAPGAQIFVDFGFSDIPNLYRPEDLITFAEQDNGGLQKYLYDEKIGFITKNQGDVEVLQGIVIDYSATVKPNGGVDCSVTLTSKNSALLSFTTGDDVGMKVKNILTRGILYLGLRAIVSQGDNEDTDNDLKQLMSTPNADSTSDTVETYNKNLLLLAQQELSGKTGPEGNSIRTGVFVENLNADNSYIAWGLFEDLIINSQFGFGKDNDDIVNGKNLQVKMNSSNAFTRWTVQNREKQHVLMQVPEDVPSFMYPEWWGGDEPAELDRQGNTVTPAGGSYSYQKGKLPEIIELDENQNPLPPKTYQNGELTTKEDKFTHGRIPIREVFINVDMIVKALNKEGDGLFDWRMKQGETDAEIEIIDANYTITSENKDLDENKLFTFKVQSPNSMIKDYNLGFKLPSGNIGNMYAIQGMGVGDAIFSTDEDVQQAISAGTLDKDLLKIIYEPDMGNYRVKQLLDEPKVDSEVFNVFTSVDNLFDTNVYKISTTEEPNLIRDTEFNPNTSEDEVIEGGLTNKKSVTARTSRQPTLSANEIMKTSDANLEAAGFKVAKTFKEYYKYKINSSVQSEIPNLLPYTLNLTILGIASIQVGDTFKVDYLPKRYQEVTYLQVIKVTHEIGPGGWYTALDTQFRLLPKVTDIVTPTKQDIRLSPSALTNAGYEDEIEADDGLATWGNKLKIADLAQYMTDIEIKYDESWAFDYSIDFKMVSELKGDLKDSSGVIQNHEGNFRVMFANEDTLKTAIRTQNDNGSDSTFYDKYGQFGSSENLAYHYSDSFNYRVWPPDFRLKPNGKYTLMAYGDKIGILDKSNPYYQKTFNFFKNYMGFIRD